MPRDLWQLLEQVVDERSFVAFVEALGEDFAEERRIDELQPGNPYSHGPLGWQSKTIDEMLEAAAAWATDGKITSAENVWRRCAEILFAGKHYE